MFWKHRYTVLTILFCSWLLCYVDRMVMATAIPFIAKDFDLSPLEMGQVLSAFFLGYALMQIPGGVLADRFGPRAILTSSIVWWSVLTAMTGMVPGLIAILVVRVLFGVGEGLFPAAAAKALSNWFPRREIGRANGVVLASTAIGSTVAPLFVVACIQSWGWRSVFYALFAPGIVIAWAIWIYVRNSPADSKHVSHQELTESDADNGSPTSAKSSLWESLRTSAVLWCALCMFFSNMVAWGLRNWLPTYLLQARGFEPEKMGIFAGLINLAGVVGYVLGGYICDKYFRQKLRILIMVGSFATAVFIYLAASAPTGEWASAHLVIVFLVTNVVGAAICTVPMIVVTKQAVGSAFGIMNTAASIAGVLSPVLIGYLLNSSANDFELVLYWLVGLSIVAIFPAIGIHAPTSHMPDNNCAPRTLSAPLSSSQITK